MGWQRRWLGASAIAALGAQVFVASCGGKLAPDGSEGANGSAARAGEATPRPARTDGQRTSVPAPPMTPPTSSSTPSPSYAPPEGGAGEAGASDAGAPNCTVSSGPDAWPPRPCTCDPAAVGEYATRTCQRCSGGGIVDGGVPPPRVCVDRPWDLHEGEAGVPGMGFSCSIGCFEYSTAPDCTADAGEMPRKECSCSPVVMKPLADRRCSRKPFWDLVPYEGGCILRCLDFKR